MLSPVISSAIDAGSGFRPLGRTDSEPLDPLISTGADPESTVDSGSEGADSHDFFVDSDGLFPVETVDEEERLVVLSRIDRTCSAESLSASSGRASIVRSRAVVGSRARARRVTASRSALYPRFASSVTRRRGVSSGTSKDVAHRRQKRSDWRERDRSIDPMKARRYPRTVNSVTGTDGRIHGFGANFVNTHVFSIRR